MIVQWFIDRVFGLWDWLLLQVPAGAAPPGWLTGGVDLMVSLLTSVTSMGVWFPLPLALTMANLVLVAMVAGSSVKMLRIVVSFFTGGGGGAA